MKNRPTLYNPESDLSGIPEQQTVPSRWLESWELATTQAEQDNKFVVACFTGSDWCTWCERLENEVFHTPEFDAWAQQNAVLLKLDFPRHARIDPAIKRQNEELAKRYTDHIGGYPTVLILTPDGTVIGELGFVSGGPTAWIKEASRFTTSAPTDGS